MKFIFFTLVLLAISLAIPLTSFADKSANCNFGGQTTSLEHIFEKDLAVKAFSEKHPDSTRKMATDESGSAKNQFVLQAKNDGTIETLEIKFHIDTNGCYIPADYHYSYDDGTIDVNIRNSVGNFTEIVNLIKQDSKTIKDFYPDDCNFVDLDYTVTSGKYFGACEGIDSNSITILIDAETDGTSLEVDIPIMMLYSLSSTDCKPSGDFFVVLDSGEEAPYEITPTNIGNMVKVELPEGFHKIEIIGFFILPDPSPAQYCGIVEGYLNKKYLAPLDQTDHGVSPHHIRCNDGLILIQSMTELQHV